MNVFRASRLLMIMSVVSLLINSSSLAQTIKKVRVVTVKDSNKVIVDSLHSDHNVFIMKVDGEKMTIDIDSLIKTMDKNAKIMAFKLDSLGSNQDVIIYSDGHDDGEERIKIMMESNNMDEDELHEHIEMFKGKDPHKMIWVGKTGTEEMNIETIVDSLEDGKVISKTVIIKGGGGDHQVFVGEGSRKYEVIVDSDVEHGEQVHVMKRHLSGSSKKTLETVSMQDLHILKEAGFSANVLTAEPLELKSINVNVNREKTESSDRMDLELGIVLSASGKASISLIDKDGKKLEETPIEGTSQTINYTLNEASSPYYVVILQNKQIWGRKVNF